jgi:hypothetical protein
MLVNRTSGTGELDHFGLLTERRQHDRSVVLHVPLLRLSSVRQPLPVWTPRGAASYTALDGNGLEQPAVGREIVDMDRVQSWAEGREARCGRVDSELVDGGHRAEDRFHLLEIEATEGARPVADDHVARVRAVHDRSDRVAEQIDDAHQLLAGVRIPQAQRAVESTRQDARAIGSECNRADRAGVRERSRTQTADCVGRQALRSQHARV